MEPKDQDSLKREALEFFIGEWRRLANAREELEQQIELVEKQIIANGGAVPDSPGELQHYIIKVLDSTFRLMPETELTGLVLASIPTQQRPQKNRNGTPESQVAKSISMSCNQWKNRSTRLFRWDGIVGLFEWKAPIGRLIAAATPGPIDRRRMELMLSDSLAPVSGAIATKSLLDSAIQHGIFQETENESSHEKGLRNVIH
jgi:hypothetical protein